MSLHRANGNRVTAANLATVAETITDPDPQVRITETLTRRTEFSKGDDSTGATGDDYVQRGFNAGEIVRRSRLLAMLTPATVANLTPALGAAAGGTSVTITGDGLDGVTGVTVGGAAATNVVVVNPRKVTFTTPAGSAGPRDVVIADDAGAVTKAAGFTYTA